MKQQPIIDYKKYNFLLLTIAVSLVVGSSIWYYVNGYKTNATAPYFVVLAGGSGWLMLHILFQWRYLDNKEIKYKKKKLKYDDKEFEKKLINLGWFIGGITYMAIIIQIEQSRENSILEKEPSKTTTGVIIDVKTHQSHGSMSYEAIVAYVVNGVTIQKTVSEQLNDYIPGERYTVKYSVGRPELCRVSK